jgi:hypothetical protein
MKIVLIFLSLLIVLQAKEKSGAGIPTPWESLIIFPDKSHKSRIQIDGYLRVIVRNDGTFDFKLFADRDSLEKNRDFKFAVIETNDFMKALEKSRISGLVNIQELDRKFVTIKAEFEKTELASEPNLLTSTYRVGNLKGAILCYVEGRYEAISND